MPENKQKQIVFQVYLLVAVAGTLVSLVLLFRDPSELTSAWFLGISRIRALMALGLLLIGGIFALLMAFIRLNAQWSEKIIQRVRGVLTNNLAYGFVLLFSLISLLISSQLLRLAQISSDPFVAGYLGRLVPLLVFLAVISSLNLIFAPLLRFDYIQNPFRNKLITLIAAIFAGLAALWGFIALTGVGINPDLMGWDAPGVPVLATQVWLIWGFAVFFIGIENLISKRKLILFDVLISLLIWGTATYLWGGQPLLGDYFALKPMAPNFEFYPYSDAATHDLMAQGLLVGEGYPGIARKPLYAAFLTLLHLIAGQAYENVVFLQVMVIALLPVCLYWLAKSLHQKISGVILALLIIVREHNALRLAGVIGVSHVKLLMSDLPATLGIVLLTLLIVAWLRKPENRRIYPLAIGGTLGLLLLVRPQITVLIPAVIGFIVILFLKRLRLGIINLALFGLGLGLALFPWLWRSYQLTGQFVLNDPGQNAFLTQQYTRESGQGRLKPLPGESEGEFSQRVDDYLRDFIFSNPGYVTSFVVSHFAHNLVEMTITLPMSPWIIQDASSDLFPYWTSAGDRLWDACCSLKSYVRAQPFWDQWLGGVSREITLALLINLAVLAIGLAIAWASNGVTGWVPLGIGLVYILSTSLGRYSGWRLILPADWVLFLYFSLGLGQIAQWIKEYYGGKFKLEEQTSAGFWPRVTDISPGQRKDYRHGIILSIIFLGLGFSPLLIERFVPQRYAKIGREDIAPYFNDAPGLEQFVEEEAIMLQGRALYPRFYKYDQGEPGGEWPAFSAREYPRLGFVLGGPWNAHVVLPLDAAPEFFPHATDAIVIGCPAEEHIRAKLVVLMNEDGYTLVLSPDVVFSCDQP